MMKAVRVLALSITIVYLIFLGFVLGTEHAATSGVYEQAPPSPITTIPCSDATALTYARAGIVALEGAKRGEEIPAIIGKAESARLLATALRCFVPETEIR